MVSFPELIEAVKAASFSDDRVSTIQNLAPSLPWFGSADEIKQLLEAFSFSDEKMKAIEALAEHYANFSSSDLVAILSALSFSSDRKKALKIIVPKIWMRVDLNDVLSQLTFSDEKKLCTELWGKYGAPAQVVPTQQIVVQPSPVMQPQPTNTTMTTGGSMQVDMSMPGMQVDMSMPGMQVDMSIPNMQVDMNMPGMQANMTVTETSSTTINGVTTTETTTISSPGMDTQMTVNVGMPQVSGSLNVNVPMPQVVANIGPAPVLAVQQPVLFHVKRLGGFSGPKWQERLMEISFGPGSELRRLFKHMGKNTVKAKVAYSEVRAVYRTVAPYESFRHPYCLCIEFHSNRLDFLSFADSQDRENFIMNLCAAHPSIKCEPDHNAVVSMGKWAWIKRSFNSPYTSVPIEDSD